MSIYYSAKERGFYDSQLHGSRTLRIADPAWVRPQVTVTLQPGDTIEIDGDVLANDSGEVVTLENVPDASAVAPMIEVPNPDCRLPPDAVEITNELRQQLLAGVSQFRQIRGDANGYPVLVDLPGPSAKELESKFLAQIDNEADAVRTAVVGDPVRALEYDKSAQEAAAFRDAGYPADAVPRTVAAWAISGRTARQAADSILAEAHAYNEVLYFLRETRLSAKERVRALVAAGDLEGARQLANDTVEGIRAAANVGNAKG